MHLAEPPAGTGTSLDRPVPAYSDGSARRRALRWTARHNTPLTIVAAGLVPILYLVFIGSYAVNSFQADDWSLVPLVHAALHGGLSLGQLWQQHNESRLLVGNVIDVLFGFTDRLDARAIIFFSAGVFIAAYVCLLMLARKYLPTRLTPITVVTIGVLWFSLADIQNILWAFQVSWYLTVFFFVAMLYSLLVPERRRVLWFAAAVLLAVASSLSTVQGFISWPIGAICILWPGPSRRGRSEIAIWFGTMLGRGGRVSARVPLQSRQYLRRRHAVHDEFRAAPSADLGVILLRAHRKRHTGSDSRFQRSPRFARSLRGGGVGALRRRTLRARAVVASSSFRRSVAIAGSTGRVWSALRPHHRRRP